MMKAFCLPSNSMKVVEKMTCEILKLNAADHFRHLANYSNYLRYATLC